MDILTIRGGYKKLVPEQVDDSPMHPKVERRSKLLRAKVVALRRDGWRHTRNQVGNHSRAAKGQRPAQAAMATIEKQVAIGCTTGGPGIAGRPSRVHAWRPSPAERCCLPVWGALSNMRDRQRCI